MVIRELEMLDQEIKRTEALIRQMRYVDESTETSGQITESRAKKNASTNTPHDWQVLGTREAGS